MKSIIYRIVESGMRRVLPESWVNKDTAGAVILIVLFSLGIGAGWLLTGCHGYRVYSEYEHHSSVPDLKDKATTDQVGLCLEYPLGDHKYVTEMTICAHDEVGGGEVFGRDPVGTVRIRQPIYIKRF
jgi:hypothetical protein